MPANPERQKQRVRDEHQRAEQLLARVVAVQPEGCALWPLSKTGQGHALIWNPDTDKVRWAAHRLLELDGRPRPSQSYVMRRRNGCTSNTCVSTAHVWWEESNRLADDADRARRLKEGQGPVLAALAEAARPLTFEEIAAVVPEDIAAFSTLRSILQELAWRGRVITRYDAEDVVRNRLA